MPVKTLKKRLCCSISRWEAERGCWMMKNIAHPAESNPLHTPSRCRQPRGAGTSMQALERWQMPPVCLALCNKTSWNALQNSCQAEPRAVCYRQKQPQRLEEWHLCEDLSPWHPMSGWWHLRILITKGGWLWFSVANRCISRYDLFLTPHPAKSCFAEPVKRLGVHRQAQVTASPQRE